MYWYPVVARNYCLIAVFLFLLVSCFAEFDSGGKPIYLICAMGHSCIRDAERLPESFALLYQSPYASLKEEDYQIYILRK